MPSLYEKITKQGEEQESKEMLPEPVYYVESSDDGTVLVGIDVTVEKSDNGESIVTWFDTSHERKMTASEIKQDDEYFAFKRADREGGQFYKFTPMNLETYQDKVKDKLIAGRDFEDLQDLINAFIETKNKVL